MTSTQSSRFITLSIFLLIGVLLFAFWGIWNFDYVFYDDINYVKENPYVLKGLSKESIVWALTSFQHHVWHPLTWISFMLDTEIYGPVPFGYHLTNLIFHILNTLLLFIFLIKTTKSYWPSLIVVLLFCIHPLRVESVVWITERKDVLSFFFLMLALLSYRKNYFLTLLFFILGVMSKMMLVTFPLLLLLLDRWPLGRDKEVGWFRLIVEKTPFFALSFLASIWNLYTYKSTGLSFNIPNMTLFEKIAAIPLAYGEYLLKTILPINLSVYQYHLPIHAGLLVSACAALLGLTVFVLKNKKSPHLFMGWFWFFNFSHSCHWNF